MTYFSIGGSDFGEWAMACFVVIIVLGIAGWVGYAIIRKKDGSKPLQTRRVKILERPVQKGSVEWYVVECENGERMKLRSFQGQKLFITVGDEGMISYRGITIETFQSFQRK